jgi:signal-transduction protein with cAMP-binding, CBS, and nucleotidyltransferase domain
MWPFDLGKRSRLNGARRLLTAKVKDVMTDYVVTITPEKSAVDAASVMVGENVSALIVERDAKPVGVLTERDFITKVPLSKQVFNLSTKDIMSAPLLTIGPNATLADARNFLHAKGIRKLAVLDKEGRIDGIITQTDLSKQIYEKLRLVPKLGGVPFLVREVMTKRVIFVPTSAKFSETKRLMAKENVSALPVTEGKQYVGIFTEYDVVTQFYDAGGKLDIKEVPALMKSPIKAIPATLSIFDANMIMLFEGVRRLPVIEEKKIVGIVTQTDIIHACFAYAEKAATYFEEHPSLMQAELIELRRSSSIISEYAGEHIRAFTVRASK